MLFCERQWALIHMEGEWEENYLTATGTDVHQRVHSNEKEFRDGVLSVRGLPLRCVRLGLYGVSDAVEFYQSSDGVRLPQRRGRWTPLPVEYKRGRGAGGMADKVQLCGQALCLEEMLQVSVPVGVLFYAQTRRRTEVTLTKDLRDLVERLCCRARSLLQSGVLPPPEADKKCKSCSMKDLCGPELRGRGQTRQYMLNTVEAIIHETA